jgi:hypothetical protein
LSVWKPIVEEKQRLCRTAANCFIPQVPAKYTFLGWSESQLAFEADETSSTWLPN